MSVNLSYSEENGFGAGVTAGVAGMATVSLSQSEYGGTTVSGNLGLDLGGGMTMGLNASYNTEAGFSGGASLAGNGFAGGISYTEGAGLSAFAGGAVGEQGQYKGGIGWSEQGGIEAYAEYGISGQGSSQINWSDEKGWGAKLKTEYVDLSYNEADGFGIAAHYGGANFSYTESGGLASSFSGSGVAGGFNGPMINSLDALESSVDSQSKQIAAENLKNKQDENALEKLGELGLSDDEINAMLNDPEQREAALKMAGMIDDVDGGESNTCSGCSRDEDSITDQILGGLEDIGRGFLGETSTDDGYVDAEGNYHQRTCFTAGTKVKTIDGFKNIEDIRVGDMVLSRNEDENADGEIHYSRVTQLFVRQTDLLYILTFEDGTRLETTWNHPFWVEGSGWVETKDLKPGDLTVLSSGERLEIQSVEEAPQEQEVTVYNFEVHNDHTYFVADKTTSSDDSNFIWVHNEVEQYTNEVDVLGIGSGENHAFVVATPEDQEAFKEYFEKNKDSGKVFQKVDENGNPMVDKNGNPVYSIIFRAGPDGLPPSFGNLSNVENLEKDSTRLNEGDYSSKTTVLTPNGNDTNFVNSLINSDANYTYNYNMGTTPEYEAFPDANDFENNSNSYINGLLQSAGVTPVKPPVSVPGWDKPVNNNFFNVPSDTIGTNTGICGQNMSCPPSNSSNSGCGVIMSCAQ